jgi:hypothetical protein
VGTVYFFFALFDTLLGYELVASSVNNKSNSALLRGAVVWNAKFHQVNIAKMKHSNPKRRKGLKVLCVPPTVNGQNVKLKKRTNLAVVDQLSGATGTTGCGRTP